MKHIVVPVDFSNFSEKAFKVAAAIAKNHNAKLYVLHMLELNEALLSSKGAALTEQTVFLIKLAEKRLKDFLNKPYLDGVHVVPIIKHFKVFSEISLVAKEHEADLIVMGSQGSEGLKELFIGSNTQKVVRHSDIPVLVIKDDLASFDPNTMVFACDLNIANVHTLERALEISKKFSAELKPVYINTPGEDFLSTTELNEKVKVYTKKAGLDLAITVYNDYSVEKGILSFAKATKADLIGVPTHGRKGLSNFFLGSIGEDLANHASIPVVTFKI